MYLYGASGHAKVIIDILKSTGISIDGIIDDNQEIKYFMTYSVSPQYNPEVIKNEKIIVSIGNNKLRERVVKKIITDFGIAIHKSAFISEFSSINVGTVVMQNATVQSHAIIGRHVIINSAAIVDHDCVIEDFVHVSPNATLCGNVKVGEGTHIGAGAIVIPGICVGRWSIIGAGSVIIRDVPDNVVIVGNPGKILKKILC
jgi:sugar O-acyltransferase (sialic acid O-acetyltransferase NeuD family)